MPRSFARKGKAAAWEGEASAREVKASARAGEAAAREGEAVAKRRPGKAKWGAAPPRKAELYACPRLKCSCLQQRRRRVRQGYNNLFRPLSPPWSHDEYSADWAGDREICTPSADSFWVHAHLFQTLKTPPFSLSCTGSFRIPVNLTGLIPSPISLDRNSKFIFSVVLKGLESLHSLHGVRVFPLPEGPGSATMRGRDYW
jgi:hypothetical protein